MNSSDFATFNNSILINSNDTVQVCFNRTTNHGSSLWIENSVEKTLPPFVLQLAIVLTLNRILLFVSELYHVPRIVANIFAGFLLGPSVLGRRNVFFKSTFPLSSLMPLETIGALILVYYVFLVGLEIDLKPITRLHKKAMVFAMAGTIFTLPIGFGLYYLLVTDMGRKSLSHVNARPKGAILWGITLSCSSDFPEIAKILSDQKLLLTDNGQLALTASLLNDLFSWCLLLFTLTQFYHTSVTSFVISVVIVSVCILAVHPIFKWLFSNVGMRDRVESQVIFVLHMVLVIGYLTDGLGVHSITGAFLLGVVIPQGALNNAVLERVHEFVAVFMMPLFFVAVGERMKIQDLALDTHGSTVLVVIVLALVVKIVCTMVVSWSYQMPSMEGLSLALLMNTKGIMPLIILCTGKDKLELDNQSFGVMLLACWLMTIPLGPFSAALNKALKPRKYLGGQRKSKQETQPDSPLRLLACIHTKRDANVIINLLKASCPSVRIPIQVLAVELNKMTTRPTSSSLIIRDAKKPSFASKSSKLDTEDTLGCFDNLNQAIFAEKMRIISDYNSMHKDILNLAGSRGVTLILTTLYKQPTYDGLGAGAATARAVNIINRDHASKDEKKVVLESLVKHAPCCVAIFVDRGMGHKRLKEQRVAMFYISGADDREALSYAWRMSRSSEVKLTVVRLVWENPNDEFDETDKDFIKGFVQQTGEMGRVRYLEKVVRDEKETVKLLNKIGNKGFDLFVVGRGHGRKMSLAQTVDPVLEEPALGPLGDTLSDLNSAAETSILIFQRQAPRDVEGNKHVRSNSTYDKVFDSMMEQQLMCPSTGFPMFLSHYA